MYDVEDIRTVLEVIYYVAAIVGIPVAIGVFLHEKKQERRKREIDMYLQSSDRYMQFLTLYLEHPELKCGDLTGDEQDVTESGFSLQQLVLYEILLITLEQAYYLYTKNRLSAEGGFWEVWREYIQWWASRPDFRKAWKAIDPYLDPGFMAFMQSEFYKYTSKDVSNQDM